MLNELLNDYDKETPRLGGFPKQPVRNNQQAKSSSTSSTKIKSIKITHTQGNTNNTNMQRLAYEIPIPALLSPKRNTAEFFKCEKTYSSITPSERIPTEPCNYLTCNSLNLNLDKNPHFEDTGEDNEKERLVTSLLYSPSFKNSSFLRSKSCGQRLYSNGITILEKCKAKANKKREEILQKEMTECTFSPKVSDFASLTSAYTRLNDNIIRNMYNEFQDGNCNYLKIQPSHLNFLNSRVNKNSSKKPWIPIKKIIVKKIQNEPQPHIEKLFKDHQKMKDNQERRRNEYYTRNYSFTPKINRSEDKYNDNEPRKRPGIMTFFYRLQNWVDKRNEKYKADMEKCAYDPTTGLRMFYPSINHSMKDFALNERNRNKFKELFEDWKRRKTKNDQNEEGFLKEVISLSSISFMGDKSRQMIESLLVKIFQKIFVLLSNNGGYIDKTNAHLDALPIKISQIIQPLIFELQDQDETLNCNEFILACEELFKVITSYEKQTMVEWYFAVNKTQMMTSRSEFPFKPEINPRSQSYANKNIKGSLYSRSNDFLQKKNAKLSQMRGGEIISKRSAISKDKYMTEHPKPAFSVEPYSNRLSTTRCHTLDS